MLLDLGLGFVLLVLLALGAWRGAVVSGSGLVGLLAGYGGAALAAMHLAEIVATHLVVSPFLAPAIAGTLGFVVTWLVVSAATDVLVAWDRTRVEVVGRGALDRGLGGLFGLARGGLIVVLLSVMMNWLDAARDLGVLEGLGGLPDAQASALATASGDLVEVAVSTALSDTGPGGDMAARITARPGLTLASVQSLVEDPRVTQLFEDRLLWTLIQNDSIDYAMNRNAIRSIVKDTEMRGRFADLGLVGEAAREDSSAFRAELADVLSKVAPKINRLHQDPEIQSLASDPEIIELVQSGRTFALISHPRIKKLVDELSQDL